MNGGLKTKASPSKSGACGREWGCVTFSTTTTRGVRARAVRVCVCVTAGHAWGFKPPGGVPFPPRARGARARPGAEKSFWGRGGAWRRVPNTVCAFFFNSLGGTLGDVRRGARPPPLGGAVCAAEREEGLSTPPHWYPRTRHPLFCYPHNKDGPAETWKKGLGRV